MSNGCDCEFCRRKDFGNAYAMFLYSEIINSSTVCMQLKRHGVIECSIGDDSLGGYLSAMRYYADESISILFDEDEESKKWIKQLKEWKLLDKLNDVIKEYNKLWEN